MAIPVDWPQWPRHGAGINNWHLLLGGLNHLLHFCNRIPGKDTWDLYRAKKPLLSITYKVSWTSSDQTGNRQNALSLPVFYQPWMLPLYVVVYCTVLYATLWLEVFIWTNYCPMPRRRWFCGEILLLGKWKAIHQGQPLPG